MSDMIEVKNALRALINRPGSEADAIAYIEEVVTGFGGMGVGAGGNKTIEVPRFCSQQILKALCRLRLSAKSLPQIVRQPSKQKSKRDMPWVYLVKRQRIIWTLSGGYETHSHTRLAPSVFRRPRLKARALFSNYRLRSEKQMIRATQLGDSALGWHASAQEQLFVMCPAKPRASSISDPTSKHSEFSIHLVRPATGQVLGQPDD